MRKVRTRIEDVRRRDLVEAAYLTFLEHGMQGMTMARIGERAGMSHGIVNYYFESKDQLLSAVVRRANFEIMRDTARRLAEASGPRQRISAVIRGNFPAGLYTREVARAWVSYYAAIGHQPEFERLQNAVDRRLASNLHHAFVQLAGKDKARELSTSVAIMIDGLWLRHAKSGDRMDAEAAIRHVERFVDGQLGKARD